MISFIQRLLQVKKLLVVVPILPDHFSVEEAQDLANILKTGKLPAPAKIVQEQVVGPTLGEEAVNGGIAFISSFHLLSSLS
jgi:preprotein translocase subunit SecD